MNSTHFFWITAALCTALECHASLIAHYQFDEDSGATTAVNAVAGNTDGLIGTNVTTGVPGISGNAYQFTGAVTQADIVDMDDASFLPAITTSGQYTLSVWVNSNEVAGGRNVVVFAGDSTDSNSYIDLGTAIDATTPPGQAYMRHRVDTNTAGATSYLGGAEGVVVDGTWHHIAMTANASTQTLTLYVDGIERATGTLVPGSSGDFPILNRFEIGRLGRSSPVDGYEGLVDDVQVYDNALSAEQIAFLFAHPGSSFSADDTDGDGLSDAWEILYFGDINAYSGNDIGPDADGATNLQEQAAGTHPVLADTDNDGRTDGEELNLAPLTNPLDPDSDDDGLSDGDEVQSYGTNPNEADSDSDMLPDLWEIQNSLNPISDIGDDGGFGDPDDDELLNWEEYNDGNDSTDPHDPDSDDDGYTDAQEDRIGTWGGVEFTGTQPNNPDSDGDGILDGDENPDLNYSPNETPGTDPNLADSDSDGFGDFSEFRFGSDPTDPSSFPVVARGLIAHFKFDEGVGDQTAMNELGDSHGRVGSNVVTGMQGVAGNAYQFNNDASSTGIVDMGNATFLTDLTASQALTITAWIKSSDTSSGRNVAISASNSALANSYVDMSIVGEGVNFGSLNGRLRPNGNINNSELFSTSSTDPVLVNDDAWHHVALTIDLATTTQRLFVDGSPVAENQAIAATILPMFNSFEVGRLGRAVPTDAFAGLMDDIQIYNEALSEERIASLHATPGISADEDHDRLDDQWEITYFGSIAAQDGDGDPDGDNISNEDEETAGTPPIVITTLEVLSSNFNEQGEFVIEFKGAPATTYQVTHSPTLEAFEPLDPALSITTDAQGYGTALVPLLEASASEGFFRIESE
ncbi:uncharacterized protein YaaQ [Haloferula luteola]|uniref:Uncharacterized protein YaaQ n=1 Tax=Haloferula luteola TaxID=595692 RepID=A0A840V1C9_9BACT|nr:LamG domain-containing protein [Haloferula luteola]MBB5351795.1 uncharacterized protein YaaQ [Haloferula luteola]